MGQDSVMLINQQRGVDYLDPSRLFKVSAYPQSDCACFQPWDTLSAIRELLLVLVHPDRVT